MSLAESVGTVGTTALHSGNEDKARSTYVIEATSAVADEANIDSCPMINQKEKIGTSLT